MPFERHYIKYSEEHGSTCHDFDTFQYYTTGRICALQRHQCGGTSSLHITDPWHWHLFISLFLRHVVLQILHKKTIIKRKKIGDATQIDLPESSRTIDWLKAAPSIWCHPITGFGDGPAHAPALHNAWSADGGFGSSLIREFVSHVWVCVIRYIRGASFRIGATKWENS